MFTFTEHPTDNIILQATTHSYWPTKERLKILTFLLFDLQTSMRGQNGVEFFQESTGHVGFFLALLWLTNERPKILTFLLFNLQTSMRVQNE